MNEALEEASGNLLEAVNGPMGMRRKLVAALAAAAVAIASCTTPQEASVSSPPIEHPELIVESGSTPLGVSNFGLLVTELDGLAWAFNWFGVGVRSPDGFLKHDAVLLVAITEAGSCPIEYEGLAIVGSTIEIQSADTTEGPCTSDAHFRSIVLRLPKADLPSGDLHAEVQGQKFPVRRLASEGRWMRDAILTWFEDVPEQQLAERGVLGGTMRSRVIAFPADFAGTSGNEFFVLLEDGHVVSTYRYRVTPSLFWKAKRRVRDSELRWTRLLTKQGFEVWEKGRNGFVPYMRNY